MAFINKEGKKISFECSELIQELERDIEEFGGNEIVAVWCKNISGVTIYTNYDFMTNEKPLMESELKAGEHIKKMGMADLLTLLEKQNSIID